MKTYSTSLKMASCLTKYCFTILLSLFSQFAIAQVDKEFWFAVPMIGDHGNGNAELVVSNMDKANAVTVNISNPGNPTNGWGIAGKNYTVPAGQSLRIDLNALYGTPENPTTSAAGTLYNILNNTQLTTQLTNNKGLLIKATGNITAFYELGRDVPGFPQGNNIEIFSLKGNNALGTDFMLPFQNQYQTWGSQESYSSANIIASEDNTQITINPTQPAVGHPAGVPFTITLNKGQTFTLRAVGLDANQHLSGTSVKSNKPIAITLVDDSLETDNINFGGNSGGIDMVGDQIVPLNVIGKEYIVARGNAGDIVNGAGDKNRIIILTTQPNTNITISENNVPSPPYLSQGAGVTINYLQPTTAPASYIKSDKPIYVFYVSGSGNELGGALIPPIVCTGSDAVNIVRSTPQEIYLIILAKNKLLTTFTFKKGGLPTTSLISPGDFKQVSPGPEGYSIYNKRYNNNDLSQIPLLTPISIENSAGVFHAGISVTGSSSGSFGYFSDFNSINISYANKPVCFGEKLVLDGGPGRDTWKWYTKTNNIENVPSLANTQTYEVNTPGQQKIYLRIEKKGCPLIDSVDVFIQPKVNLSILRKKIACDNQPVSMDATPEVTSPPLNIVKYIWYSKTPTIPDVPTDTFAFTQNVVAQFPVSLVSPLDPLILVPHKIMIKVTDDKGCVSTDSVEVTINNAPAITLASFPDAKVCSGDSVKLGIVSPSIKYVYKWKDAGIPPLSQIKATGLSDSTISNPKASRTNSTLLPITHTYYINTLDTSTSCLKVDDLVLTINPLPKVKITSKKIFCKNESSITLTGTANIALAIGPGDFFIETIKQTLFNPTTVGKYKVKYTDTTNAGCRGSIDTVLTVNEQPVVAMASKSYCSGDSTSIGISFDATFKYLWTSTPAGIAKLDSNNAKIKLKNPGTLPLTPTYELTVTSKDNANCTNKGTVTVTINPKPVASFTTVNPLGINPIGYCINSADVPFVGTPIGGSFSSTNASMTKNVFSPKFIGSNLVKYTVTTYTCTDDTIIDIKVNKLPEPKISGIAKLVYCVGDPALTITGNASSTDIGTFAANPVLGVGGNFPLTTAGTFVFKYDITDNKGCTASTDTSFDIKAIPTVAVTPAAPNICLGETATLVASGGTSYIWTGLSSSLSTVVVKPIITSNYSVVALNADNCKSASQAVTVTVNKTPVANFPDKSIDHCFELGDVSLYAGLATSYLWSDGSVIDTLKISDGGFYKVTLLEGICKASDSVIVIAICPPRVFLPKAFSPNNDGYNDSLQIFGDHFKDIKFRVFNRWGEVVFESTQKDKMWDGTYNGANMPAGVYPWVLNYKSELAADKNKIFSVDGSVSIIE